MSDDVGKLVRGKDGFEAFHKKLLESIKPRIWVGIKDNPEFAERLIRNEYGIGVPERDAVRRFVRRHKKRGIKRGLRRVLQVGLTKDGIDRKAQETMGEVTAGKLRKAIKTYRAKPNDPDTVKEKGKDDPLEDTGAMVEAITSWME